MKPCSRYTSLQFLEECYRSSADGAGLACLLAVVLIGVTACGKGGDSPNPSSAAAQLVAETGAPSKIVRVAGTAAAVVALFPDGHAYYSPDGFNLAGGGATVPAYRGSLQVMDVVAVGGGVDALLSNGSVYFSPDGRNLGGGGATVSAYSGPLQVASLTAVGSGVDAVFANSGPAYYSPDGKNVGGGSARRIYAGGVAIQQIVAIGPAEAVVTLFGNGEAMYSPDNSDLGGGGNTLAAAPATVKKLVQVGGGVLAELGSGEVFLSPDGQNLAGGGDSILVADWNTSLANGPFGARDSAHGAEFLGRLWLSGGFADATNSNSCFDTCSYYDLWSSTDSEGSSWNTSPSFATATSPDPRDATPIVNNGVQDAPLPTDFYDSYSALVVWNGELTAIGATVWRSADGVSWTRNSSPGPLPPPTHATENSKGLILGGSLYLIQVDTGEVYRSSDPDAAVWADLGAIAGFTARCGGAAFTLLDRMWVVGGGACDYSQVYNDVWSSADGVNWVEETDHAAWSARMWPCVATDGTGIVWLAGGYAPTDWNNTGDGPTVRYGANHADVWYSEDGIDWKQLKADAGSGLPDDGGLEPRHAPTCYITGAVPAQNLLIIAGTGGPNPDDGEATTLNSMRALPLPAAAALP